MQFYIQKQTTISLLIICFSFYSNTFAQKIWTQIELENTIKNWPESQRDSATLELEELQRSQALTSPSSLQFQSGFVGGDTYGNNTRDLTQSEFWMGNLAVDFNISLAINSALNKAPPSLQKNIKTAQSKINHNRLLYQLRSALIELQLYQNEWAEDTRHLETLKKLSKFIQQRLNNKIIPLNTSIIIQNQIALAEIKKNQIESKIKNIKSYFAQNFSWNTQDSCEITYTKLLSQDFKSPSLEALKTHPEYQLLQNLNQYQISLIKSKPPAWQIQSRVWQNIPISDPLPKSFGQSMGAGLFLNLPIGKTPQSYDEQIQKIQMISQQKSELVWLSQIQQKALEFEKNWPILITQQLKLKHQVQISQEMAVRDEARFQTFGLGEFESIINSIKDRHELILVQSNHLYQTQKTWLQILYNFEPMTIQ